MNLSNIASGATNFNAPTSSLTGERGRLTGWPRIAVSGALFAVGTSSVPPTLLEEMSFTHENSATTSGWTEPEAKSPALSTAAAVSELRRLSGLTWEELARLFGVSLRSVHHWASGEPLHAANEQRLRQVHDLIRSADRGDARSTRAAIFDVQGGNSTFDLLVARQFDQARARLGPGSGRPHLALGALSPEAARRPLPPEILANALQDRVHEETGRGRGARTLRSLRREPT